jgi:hypothetical protein
MVSKFRYSLVRSSLVVIATAIGNSTIMNVFALLPNYFVELEFGFSCSFFPKCNIVLLRRLLLSSPLALPLMLAQLCSSLGGDVIE